MNEQLSTYKRIIQNLIDAVDSEIPLEVSEIMDEWGGNLGWQGNSYLLCISQELDKDYLQIKIITVNDFMVADAEEITIASTYAMVGKFIELES